MRKKINFPTRIEKWVKKYQSILSIFIPLIISIAALIISMDANRISKEQKEKEKLPIWDYNLISDSESKSIEFTSLKTGFKIQNIEVITPGFNINQKIFTYDKLSINLFDLENEILQTLNENYNFPDIIQNELYPFAYTYTYPIAIKVKYEFENSFNFTNEVFILKFKVYGKDKLIFKSLNKLKSLTPLSNIQIAQELAYIDKTQCMGRSIFLDSDEYFGDLDKIDSSISKYILLISQGSKGCNHSIQFMTTQNKDSAYIEYSVPALICDSTNYKNFLLDLDSLKSTWSKKNDYLLSSQARIDSFIKENPFGQNSRKINPNSTWYNTETFSNWENLIEEIKINIWKHYKK